MMINTLDIKQAAKGRWPEILARLGGVSENILDGRHHPCPKCGGNDRFSMIDRDAGALLCRKCFAKANGDGLAALEWLTGKPFQTVVQEVGSFLGVQKSRRVIERPDLLVEITRKKHIPLESLKKFGAHVSMRGKLEVVRVPMFDPHGAECSYFDMATIDEKWMKGLAAKDLPSGLFLPTTEPLTGKTVLITEGVKDAAALDSLGYLAVGLPTKEMEPRFARWFAGSNVVIVPDRDKDGEAGARKTANILTGVAASVRLASLPGEIRDFGGDGVREILRQRNGEKALRQAIDDAVPVNGTASAKKTWKLEEACHEYLLKLADGGGDLRSSGLLALDDALGGGVAPGELIVVGARPSNGKTLLALQWIDQAAQRGIPSLMVSEEMSAVAIGKRQIKRITDINENDWRRNVAIVYEQVREYFSNASVVKVVESLGTTEAAVAAIEEAAKQGVKLVVVDYAQFLRGRGANRYEQVTNTSRDMKEVATRTGVTLILLCQLNREIDKRPDPTPKMSDLRESGQFEADADVILFLQWMCKAFPKYENKHEFRVYVAKNRNRGVKSGCVVLNIEPDRQMITEAPTVTEWDDWWVR